MVLHGFAWFCRFGTVLHVLHDLASFAGLVGACYGIVPLSQCYRGKQLLELPVCFPRWLNFFKKGSTLKKRICSEKQILFFRS